MLLEGFLLGLSTGSFCFLNCFSIIFPSIFSEDKSNWKFNLFYLLLFISGRLIGYIFIGIIFSLLGNITVKFIDPFIHKLINSFIYIIIGLIMLISSFIYNFPEFKLCYILKKFYNPKINFLLYGILTSLKFCPSLLAAISRVFINKTNLIEDFIYFLSFFIGTLIFIFPVLGLSFIKNIQNTLRIISRFLLFFFGLYFTLFLGILQLLIT